MKRVGKEGRAIVRSFSYPKNKDDFMMKLEDLARKEGVTFSDIIIQGLEKYWLEHGKSQNPQTEITLFKTGLEYAIPNLYKDEKDWSKFYQLIMKREDFTKIDSQLNMVLRLHNKRDRQLAKVAT